jgi:hypothetical protein
MHVLGNILLGLVLVVDSLVLVGVILHRTGYGRKLIAWILNWQVETWDYDYKQWRLETRCWNESRAESLVRALKARGIWGRVVKVR